MHMELPPAEVTYDASPGAVVVLVMIAVLWWALRKPS